MLDRFVFVYNDDILIFSQNMEEHVAHVHKVLQCLLENKLFVKPSKCDFHASSFLGFLIEQGQLKADPEKICVMMDWPAPVNRKQLQRFLGFANFYRCFIMNYSRITTLLSQLTSSKVNFVWSPAA